MGVYIYPQKARVRIERTMACPNCHPWPFAERKWTVWFPYDNNTTSFPRHPRTYDTWAEAMAVASTYRPPMLMNYATGNNSITAVYPSWINNHKWG
jgi:hypothetical protein